MSNWNFLQTPPYVALTQSPTIASVTYDGYETSSGFQYTCELYYWSGSKNAQPTSSQYTLVKYPNDAGSGIFDFSRILNSTLQRKWTSDSADNTKWFTYKNGFQFLSGSTIVTGSSIQWAGEALAIDGYQLYPEEIQTEISPLTSSLSQYTPFFPALTSGPATQSVWYDCSNDDYQMNLYQSWQSYQPEHDVTGGYNGYLVRGLRYVFSDGNYVDSTFPTASLGSGSDDVIKTSNFSPYNIKSIYESYYTASSFANLDWYQIRFAKSNTQFWPNQITYKITPVQKYPVVQIMWKNRFGEMDSYNFTMVSRESFGISRSQYSPQLGTWNSSTLSYGVSDSSIQTYLVDTNTSLLVNSDWLSEDYNQIFKQLLVSDEIYWVYDQEAYYNSDENGLKPLSIKTSDIQFKTGVVDKLIQYQFEFDYGQSYKLIL